MSEMIEPAAGEEQNFGGWVLRFWPERGVTARSVVSAAALIAAGLFVWGTRMFGLPVLPGFDGSILAQPSAFAAIAIVAVLLVISALVGTVLAGAIHFEAGIFAAACGLVALSLRGGTMQAVLFEANGSSSVYFRLMLELLLLGGFLAAILFGLGKLSHKRLRDTVESSLANDLTAMVSQAVVTALILMVVCQSEAKNQALASAAIAGLVGSVVAYKYAPTRPSFWFWIGPILTGLVGYLLAAMGQDTNLNIGVPTGTFAALARPLPVDYAGAGVAGAILGYWMVAT